MEDQDVLSYDNYDFEQYDNDDEAGDNNLDKNFNSNANDSISDIGSHENDQTIKAPTTTDSFRGKSISKGTTVTKQIVSSHKAKSGSTKKKRALSLSNLRAAQAITKSEAGSETGPSVGDATEENDNTKSDNENDELTELETDGEEQTNVTQETKSADSEQDSNSNAKTTDASPAGEVKGKTKSTKSNAVNDRTVLPVKVEDVKRLSHIENGEVKLIQKTSTAQKQEV